MATFGPVAAVSIDVAAGSTTMVALVEPTVSAKVHEKLRLAINPDRGAFLRQPNRSRDLTRSIGTSRSRAAPDTTKEETMTQIRRRKTLQLSAASALAAGTGGLAGILASGRAPAYAQTQTMHWLRWSDFVPASDVASQGRDHQAVRKRSGHEADRRNDQRQ